MQVFSEKFFWHFSMIKAEFTLTFDDYSEWQKVLQRTLRSNISIAIAFCGLFLILGGYVIARLFPPDVAQFGVACLILGLLVTLASILPRFFQPTSRRIQKESLNTFTRFYREPRNFEASETGWRYSVRTREDFRVWTDLFAFVISGQTLVLMDPLASYPIPLSALSQGDLKAVTELAQKGLTAETMFSVPVVPTAEDVMIALAKHNWFERTAKTTLLYGCGFLLLTFVMLLLADSAQSMKFSPWFALSLVLLPLIEAAHYYSVYLEYWRRSFQNASILKDGICFNLGTLHNAWEMKKIRYEWFRAVVETRRVLMLYFQKNSFFLIPKSGLVPEDLTRLRELLGISKQQKYPKQ
jgi:hypothetical protein